jgi:hypothetical protein
MNLNDSNGWRQGWSGGRRGCWEVDTNTLLQVDLAPPTYKISLAGGQVRFVGLVTSVTLKNLLNTHESIVLCKSFHLYKKLHVSIDWQTIQPGGLQGSTGLAIGPFELDI